jgi:hypothetical protein
MFLLSHSWINGDIFTISGLVPTTKKSFNRITLKFEVTAT